MIWIVDKLYIWMDRDVFEPPSIPAVPTCFYGSWYFIGLAFHGILLFPLLSF
jgi:hypothetical protein